MRRVAPRTSCRRFATCSSLSRGLPRTYTAAKVLPATPVRPTMHAPAIGCTIDELDTPALCIDLDVMESNIKRMASLCRQHGISWRPHSKAHKSPEIARWEMREGAIGVTCAKLGEAEVMATGGVHDILIANQIVGPHKIARL